MTDKTITTAQRAQIFNLLAPFVLLVDFIFAYVAWGTDLIFSDGDQELKSIVGTVFIVGGIISFIYLKMLAKKVKSND